VTLYTLHAPQPGTDKLPEAVAEKFSWFAALLPPVHALVHRLWDQLGLYVLGLGAVLIAARFIGPDASFWLYLLIAMSCGFAAPGARRRALKRRGFHPAGHRFAADADLARLSLMETRP
jgi:hypothetical protein